MGKKYEFFETYFEVSDSSYLPEGSRFSDSIAGEALRGFGKRFGDDLYRASREDYVDAFRLELLSYDRVSKYALEHMNVDFTDSGLRVWWYVRYEDDQYGKFDYVDRIEDCDEVESYDVSIFQVKRIEFKDIVSD